MLLPTNNDSRPAPPTLTIYPPAKVWTRGKNIPSILKLNQWMHGHPRVRKVAEVAAYALGIGMIAATACIPPIGAIVGLAIGGSLIIGITYLAARILNILVPTAHDMKNLAFHPDRLEKNGQLLGELSYDGVVPILKIHTSNPKDAGYTQGYLLHKAISTLRSNAEFLIFTLGRQKRPAKVAEALEAVKAAIPERFRQEMEGMVEGYNAKKGRFEKPLSLNDLLYLQLMPDSYFNIATFKTFQKTQDITSLPQPLETTEIQTPILQPTACTILGLQDEKGAPMLARTVDWMSFGIAGKFTLIISRYNEATKTRTAEVGIPGLVGSLTGVNDKGVSVAMNVTGYPSPVTTIEGMPSSFYNRMVLEECASFKEAQLFVESNKALGPYHLTVSDSTTSGTFSLYQQQDWTGNWLDDKKNDVKLRLLSKEKPLIATNCSCTPEAKDMFNGNYRKAYIKHYLLENQAITDTELLLRHSQSIPMVNNHLTTHRVILGHQTLKVAFDNAWAGDRELHTVNLEKVFA